MSVNERQQRMVERIQEDERLRGDLEDRAAAALVAWASEQVTQVAAEPARPDEVVEAEVQAVRAAARSAARSGESDPQRVVALAESMLAQSRSARAVTNPVDNRYAVAPASGTAPALTGPEATSTHATNGGPTDIPARLPASAPSPWLTCRRRWRERFASWFKGMRKDR